MSAVVVVAGLPAAAGSASADDGTTCKAKFDTELLPGITLSPSRGSFYSPGGVVTCDGPVLGHKVTGPGRWESSGRMGVKAPASCASGGDGWGAATITFPTTGGEYVFRTAYTYTFGAVTKKGVMSGEAEGDYADATFSLLPKKGDCLTTPLTESHVVGTIRPHAFRAPN